MGVPEWSNGLDLRGNSVKKFILEIQYWRGHTWGFESLLLHFKMDIYSTLSELYKIDINKNNIDDYVKNETIKFKTINIDEFQIKIPENVKFKCVCCGICCSQPVMLSEEERLSGLFEIELKTIKEAKYCVLKSDGVCPHLENNKCFIHKKRPMMCRKFPLVHTDVNDLKKLGLFLKYSGCQGFNIGEIERESLVPYVDAIRIILKEMCYCTYK